MSDIQPEVRIGVDFGWRQPSCLYIVRMEWDARTQSATVTHSERLEPPITVALAKACHLIYQVQEGADVEAEVRKRAIEIVERHLGVNRGS